MPGAKKGAHYSGPHAIRHVGCAAPGGRRAGADGSRQRPAAGSPGGAPGDGCPQGRSGAAGGQSRDRADHPSGERRAGRERDRLTHELRTSELSVGKLRDSLSEVRRERAERAARRAGRWLPSSASAKPRCSTTAPRWPWQLRAAYLIGRQEPLKLLLNQKDPALVGRMFAYYSYLRARTRRADQAHRGRHAAHRGTRRRACCRGSAARGAGKTATRANCARSSRRARNAPHVLASLEAQSHTTRARISSGCAVSRRGSRKLLRELRTAMERFPLEGNDAFARLRGKLAWPVSGRLVARLRRCARRRRALGRGAGGDRARGAGQSRLPGPA